MLKCLPTIIARYMYECLHNYFIVRFIALPVLLQRVQNDDIIVIAVPQYHALLVAMYEQESQNHLCIIIAQFS